MPKKVSKKIPTHIIKELDNVDAFTADVQSRYNIQSAHHHVDPLISFLYQLIPRMEHEANLVSNKYGLVDEHTNVDDHLYLQAEALIKKAGYNVPEYLRKCILDSIKDPKSLKQIAKEYHHKH